MIVPIVGVKIVIAKVPVIPKRVKFIKKVCTAALYN